MRRPASIVARCVTAGALLIGVSACTPRRADIPSAKRSVPVHAAYVWQYRWTPQVQSALDRSAGAVAVYMVLVSELDVRDADPAWRDAALDWAALERTHRDTWLVFRAHAIPEIDSDSGRRAAADTLSSKARNAIDAAQAAGVRPKGIQIDYDCPTQNLPDYALFLADLRHGISGVPISITGLPAWLGQDALDSVLEGLDHWVLQVHSLIKPSHIGDPVTLCDAARVPGWVKQAATLDRPFYVALPTYGYRLYYDAAGTFVALAAENSRETFAKAAERVAIADPQSIAALVKFLAEDPPPELMGFAWFRLPVEGDELNWTWAALEQVMAGIAPAPRVACEVRSPSDNLFEVWMINNSDYPLTGRVSVDVEWADTEIEAFDAIGGYDALFRTGVAGIQLEGPSSRPGEEKMAAWFRTAQGRPGAVRVGKVEVTQ